MMSFEEAKKIFLNRGYIEIPGGTYYYDADKWREAITLISKWLEQEPCEDAVSRRAVLDTLDKMDKALDDERSVENYKELLTECYKDLTPVIPKKTEWTLVSNGLPKLYEEVIVTDIETIDTYVSRYVGNGYWECDNGLYQNRIIAWQSKPKPYKPESDYKGIPLLKEKTGEWLRMSDLSEQEDDRYKCSYCGNVVHYRDRMNLYTFNSWCGRCGSNNRRQSEVSE